MQSEKSIKDAKGSVPELRKEMEDSLKNGGIHASLRFINQPLGLKDKLKVLIALCPLYADGTLTDSKLLREPSLINESRVGIKMAAYGAVLKAMSAYLEKSGAKLELVSLFSDAGVLLSSYPSERDEKALETHSKLYLDVLEKLCESGHITMQYHTFSELSKEYSIQYPKFIYTNDRHGLPAEMDAYQMIEQINRYLESLGIPTSIKNNNDNRGTVNDFMKMDAMEPHMVFNLISSYKAFDWKISELAGPEGIYMQAERFRPLLRIAKLTEDLKKMARIDISTW